MSYQVVNGCPPTSGDDYQLNVISILKNAYKTFPEVEIASRKMDGTIFRYNYQQAYERIQKLANALKRLGVKPGDRIGVMVNGRFVEMASTDEMMSHPCHPYTLKLFSSVPGKQPVDNDEGNGDSQIAKERTSWRPPAGCPYADQCAIAEPACREAEPDLHQVRNGHHVACFKV